MKHMKMPGTTATFLGGVSCMTCLARVVSTYLKHELGKPVLSLDSLSQKILLHLFSISDP